MRTEGQSAGFAHGGTAVSGGAHQQYMTYDQELFGDCMQARGWIRHAVRPTSPEESEEIPSPPDPREGVPSGRGLLIGGASAIGGGMIALGTGLLLHLSESCWGELDCGLTALMMGVGSAAIATGVPLMAVGGVRHRKWRAMAPTISVLPRVSATSGQLGFGLHF